MRLSLLILTVLASAAFVASAPTAGDDYGGFATLSTFEEVRRFGEIIGEGDNPEALTNLMRGHHVVECLRSMVFKRALLCPSATPMQ
jgi:hypothetical protein